MRTLSRALNKLETFGGQDSGQPAGRLWQTRINIQLLRFVANNSISKQTYTTQPALRIMERMLAFSIYTIDQFPNQISLAKPLFQFN